MDNVNPSLPYSRFLLFERAQLVNSVTFTMFSMRDGYGKAQPLRNTKPQGAAREGDICNLGNSEMKYSCRINRCMEEKNHQSSFPIAKP